MTIRTLAWTCMAASLLSRPSAATEPDTRGYDALLAERLAVLGVNGRPAATAFDYTGLHARPEAMAGLRMIHDQLLAVPPSRMNSRERTAWAINLYNFLVIERVMSHFTGGQPPGDVRYVPGFFADSAVEIEGRAYSLEAFERHFLFADFPRDTGGVPPASLDPRIHFALVPGTRGGPLLARHPFQASTLDADLDRAAGDALLSRAHVRGNPRTLRYDISSIFDWYVADFGGRAGVLRFLRRHAPEGVAGQIIDRGERALSGFIAWDWRLNQVSDEYREARFPDTDPR